MDTSVKNKRKPNPIENANPISRITFLYLFPLFKKSYHTEINETDLFRPLDEHKSSYLGAKLEEVWRQENVKHKKTALHRALFKVFGLNFMLLGVIKSINEVLLVVVQPYSIGKLVSYFEKGQTHISENEAYLYAGLYVLVIVINAFLVHPSMVGLQHISMKMRVACSSLIYRKSLRLSRKSSRETTVGHLVNLLSNDVNKFDQGFVLAHFALVGPLQTAVGTYLLYREIGYAALFGMAFLISFVPLQAWLGKKASVLRLKTALRTDERVRLMNEVLSGVQVIKMYCWEKPFAKLISTARRLEIKQIKYHSYLIGIIYSFEVFISRTSIFISILGYVLLGNYITAEKVFAITAMYNVLRPVITILFSLAITAIAEVNITVKRIQEVLVLDEREDLMEPEIFKYKIKPIKNGNLEEKEKNGFKIIENIKPKIIINNVTAKWIEESTEDNLENISLSVTQNKLIAVIGAVGSGKSSLINIILKELPIKTGNIEIVGKISYSPQEPWLFAGSVRDNILFGSSFDEERYEKVIDVCALRSDLLLLQYGDKTLVGEKGKALSGGQKARVNLARCVYKNVDIYLLDDPLSAVDAQVGKHLFEKCIEEFLSDKICILVTHQLQYLKNADKILVMNDGQIQTEGSYEELQNSGMDIAKLLESNSEEEVLEKTKIKSRQNSQMELDDEDETLPEEIKENFGTGKIGLSMYWKYFKAGGGKFSITFCLLLFIVCQLVGNGGEYYVSYWVNMEQEFTEKMQNNNSDHNLTMERDIIIIVYSSITLGTIFIAIGKSIYYMVFLTIASMNLHDFIFAKIIKATMQFFNLNPSGRILNRFSKDLGIVDEYIPSVLIDVLEIGLNLIGVIVLSALVEPWLLVPSFALLGFIYAFRTFYIKTSRSVKRLEAITKSPVFNHMTASVHGLTTIRAFQAEKLLIKEFDDYQDCHSSAWFLFIASSRGFGFWLDVICAICIGVATFVLLAFSKNIQSGEIGLVLTQFMGLIGGLQWGVRQWSELENNMTSVERVLEYTKLESEPERKPKANLSIDWPAQGEVEFKDVSLKYNESDPYVLKNLNFTIKPKEKIGVVGRTGAGKSSTITALFQLYPIEGSIIIDSINATELPLDIVRPKISIIPQEPVLFSGSMRKNLDPFDEYDDSTLWNALEQVEMKEVMLELPAGLESKVSEGGGNFSVGQRQLVCLARALIRNNKILVLDEATANVDPNTDNLIQQTIRTKFADCSVITIAHRLNTVMDSDKILVMQAGCVKEFDHPFVLLQNEDSILNEMVRSTGTSMTKKLKAIAEDNYLKNKKDK